MNWVKNNLKELLAVVGILTPLLSVVGNSIDEGAVHKGELKAKQEINETYNEALRDAIVYRAKYESCCTDLHEDQP